MQTPSGRKHRVIVTAIVLGCASIALAAPFGGMGPSVVVVRIGDGSAALTSSATPVFIDEYTSSGALVQTIALPVAASGGNHMCTQSGSATSVGFIKRSSDGRFVTMAAYDAPVGTASITSSSAATVARIIARINGLGSVDSSTALVDAYNNDNFRSAISDDGTHFWTTGNGSPASSASVRYVASLGATSSTQLNSTLTNTRVIGIFNNQLYVSAASSTFQGVSTVGAPPPPSTPQTITLLPGFPTASGPSSYEFFLADSSTLYVADDRALNTTTPANSGGIQKWKLNAGTWSRAYTLGTQTDPSFANNGLPSGTRGLTGKVTGGVATLYFTTVAVTGSNTKIMAINDTLADATLPLSNATLLQIAPTNTAYRGVAVSPAAPPDCNTNQIDDAVEIQQNPALDCDTNAVLDRCELTGRDCNQNGSLDVCDTAGNPALDCDTNGAIDSCELATHDCNTNQSLDACEIANDPARDCNTNNVPDGCELASRDCNSNGTVDICEPSYTDCDANGIGDSCELATRDCNTDTTIDSCQLATLDADSNGIIDSCEPPPTPPVPFTAGNLVVEQVGGIGSTAALTGNATPVFLREYTSAGASVQILRLPTSASGTNRRMTESGSATSVGSVTRSANGQYLTMTGYDAAVGTINVSGTSSAGVNRVIALIAADGSIDTTTAISDYSGNNIRSAVTVDGSEFWASGAGSGGGVRYVAHGASTTTAIGSLSNTRVVNIFADASNVLHLFASSMSGTNRGVNSVGSGGLPIPPPDPLPGPVTLLPGFDPSGNSVQDAYDFFFANDTTLYVCDARTDGVFGGLQKWILNTGSGNWELKYTLLAGLTPNTGLRQMTGSVAGGVATLYATTAEFDGNKVVTIQDTVTATTLPASSFTTIVSAPTNTIFRGIDFAPGATCVLGDTNGSGAVDADDIQGYVRVAVTGTGSSQELCATSNGALPVATFVGMLLN